MERVIKYGLGAAYLLLLIIGAFLFFGVRQQEKALNWQVQLQLQGLSAQLQSQAFDLMKHELSFCKRSITTQQSRGYTIEIVNEFRSFRNSSGIRYAELFKKKNWTVQASTGRRELYSVFHPQIKNMKSKSGLLYENSKKTLRVAGWFKAKTQWSKKPETFFLLFGFSLDPIQRQIETARKQAEKSIKEQKKFAWLWAVAVLLLGLFAVLRLRHVILTTFHRLIKESEDRTKAETTLNMELKEAEVARKIQISCLPKSIPKNPQYEIAAKNIPSKVVGGDIYDIFEKEDRLIVFLGDASGYSFSASLLTVSAKLGLYQEPCFENLKQIGWNINQSVRRTTGGDDSFFVTFVYSYIKEHRVHFLACGHHLFLHFKNSDQSITWFPATGFWGGFYETKEEFNHEVEENSFEVAKNDLIMIITDGITEAEKNGEEFGKKSVEKFLSVSHDLPVQKIVDGLLERVKNYADDDLTAICIRIREEK